ncbi:MAG TPA: hypothetical protein VF225_00585 [Gaiellaceae bacterium]
MPERTNLSHPCEEPDVAQRVTTPSGEREQDLPLDRMGRKGSARSRLAYSATTGDFVGVGSYGTAGQS